MSNVIDHIPKVNADKSSDFKLTSQTLHNLGAMIAQEILLFQPITINVKFAQLPDTQLSKIMAAEPNNAQKRLGNLVGQMFSYPSALVKQTYQIRRLPVEARRHVYSYLPSDISITFNALKSWHGHQGVNLERFPQSLSFELIAAQEITKGLGFMVNTRNILFPPSFTSQPSLNFMLPPPPERDLSIRVPPVYFNQSGWSYLGNISPFESLIYEVPPKNIFQTIGLISNNYSVAEISKPFSKFQPARKSITEYEADLLNNRLFYDTGFQLRQVYAGLKEKPLQIHLKDGTVMNMINETYLDPKYFSTSEFLMTAQVRTAYGLTLREKLQSLGMDSIYGPNTLKVLEEIGYMTRRKSQRLQLVSQRQQNRENAI